MNKKYRLIEKLNYNLMYRNFNVSLRRSRKLQNTVKTAMDGSFRDFEKVSQGWPNLSKLLILIALPLIISVLIVDIALADQSKTVDRDGLLAIAGNEGSVNVIVHLDVPDINQLTKASTAFKAKNNEESYPYAEAAKADAALANSISAVTDNVTSRLAGFQREVNHTYKSIPYVALAVSEESIEALESMPEVLSIVEDVLVPLSDHEESHSAPNSELFTDTDIYRPTLSNTIGIIGADDAWAAGYTGSGWYVAVIDSGIRNTHNMFAGKTIVEHCFTISGQCPNGQNEMAGTGSAAHHPATTDWAWDHGTHVAGIAAGNNGSLFGVAKSASIIAIQVFQSSGGAFTSSINAALDWLFANRSVYNIAAANMSLGGGRYFDQATCDSANASTKTAIDTLRAGGIGTVIASGNEGYCDSMGGPGCISTALAVGATTDSDAEASFNNWHPDMMDVWAPGVAINSSTGDSDSSYESWNGTSMATPHAAGAMAILRHKFPTDSVTSLFSKLTTTGKSVTTACSIGGSKPRIQVDAALSGGGGDTTVDIKINDSDGPLTISKVTPVTVTVSVSPGSNAGLNVDLFVATSTSFGWFYYNLSGAWFSGLVVTYQGALVTLSPYTVLNGAMLATPGDYRVYIAVDSSVDGIPNGSIVFDYVDVTVTP